MTIGCAAPSGPRGHHQTMGSAADASGSLVRDARARRRGRGLRRSRSSSSPSLMTLGVVGSASTRGLLAWDVRFAYLPGSRGGPRRRLAVPGARRPDPRGSEGIRVSAAARCWRSFRSRRCRSTSSPCSSTAGLLALLWLTLRMLGIRRRSLLCGGAALGAVGERRAPREHLDSARVRAGGRVAVSRHGVAAGRGRSGWRSRRSSSCGRCSCGRLATRAFAHDALGTRRSASA